MLLGGQVLLKPAADGPIGIGVTAVGLPAMAGA